jgi:hypothetical protein
VVGAVIVLLGRRCQTDTTEVSDAARLKSRGQVALDDTLESTTAETGNARDVITNPWRTDGASTKANKLNSHRNFFCQTGDLQQKKLRPTGRGSDICAVEFVLANRDAELSNQSKIGLELSLAIRTLQLRGRSVSRGCDRGAAEVCSGATERIMRRRWAV